MRDSVAIAKYKPTDGALRMHYVGSGDEPVTAILTGLSSPFTPGTHVLDVEEQSGRRCVELTITPRGKVFDLEATDEGRIARGMGIVDPEFGDSLLVSWWWGENRPAGIVKYVLGDEPDTITPTYTSAVLEAQDLTMSWAGEPSGAPRAASQGCIRSPTTVKTEQPLALSTGRSLPAAPSSTSPGTPTEVGQ